MQKVSVELNIPEGFEVAQGEQPRSVKEGEYFLDIRGEAQGVIRPFLDKVIVLRKKPPKYKIITDLSHIVNTDLEPSRYVDIEALDDLMPIVRALKNGELLEDYENDIIESIEDLLK